MERGSCEGLVRGKGYAPSVFESKQLRIAITPKAVLIGARDPDSGCVTCFGTAAIEANDATAIAQEILWRIKTSLQKKGGN